MVKSMVSIGHALGSETIAEFVDSESTLAVLGELGCDYAQGFHLHRPEMHIAGAGIPKGQGVPGACIAFS